MLDRDVNSDKTPPPSSTSGADAVRSATPFYKAIHTRLMAIGEAIAGAPREVPVDEAWQTAVCFAVQAAEKALLEALTLHGIALAIAEHKPADARELCRRLYHLDRLLKSPDGEPDVRMRVRAIEDVLKEEDEDDDDPSPAG